MVLIDRILNLVALLLWLNWREVRLATLTQPLVLSLASVIKRAEPLPSNRWIYFGGLVVLLLLRSAFYWQVGPSVEWTPAVHLGAIALHFRSDFLSRMLLFSTLSFVVTLGVFYLGLILLVTVNRTVPDSDPLQKLVRLHLGRLARWPAAVQVAVVPWLVALLWVMLHRPFSGLGLISPSASWKELWQQAIIVALGSLLAWKYFIVAILGAHLVNSYVYLGRSAVWTFVSVTAQHLLRPLRWLPLGIGKVDLAPALGMALVLGMAWFGARHLTLLYQRPPL
jgi:uncharacterized protein YggT (Ycf19 family)